MATLARWDDHEEDLFAPLDAPLTPPHQAVPDDYFDQFDFPWSDPRDARAAAAEAECESDADAADNDDASSCPPTQPYCDPSPPLTPPHQPVPPASVEQFASSVPKTPAARPFVCPARGAGCAHAASSWTLFVLHVARKHGRRN